MATLSLLLVAPQLQVPQADLLFHGECLMADGRDAVWGGLYPRLGMDEWYLSLTRESSPSAVELAAHRVHDTTSLEPILHQILARDRNSRSVLLRTVGWPLRSGYVYHTLTAHDGDTFLPDARVTSGLSLRCGPQADGVHVRFLLAMPTRYLWRPLVFDLLLWAGFFSASRYGWTCALTYWRWRRGLCTTCKYPVTGDGGVCPECGT